MIFEIYVCMAIVTFFVSIAWIVLTQRDDATAFYGEDEDLIPAIPPFYAIVWPISLPCILFGFARRIYRKATGTNHWDQA